MAQIVTGGFLGILPASSFTQTYEIDVNATSGPVETWQFARSEEIGLLVNLLNPEWDSYSFALSSGPALGTMTQHNSTNDANAGQLDIGGGTNAWQTDALTFNFDTTLAAWQALATGESITVTYTVSAGETLLFGATDNDTYPITMTFVKTCFGADAMILMADGTLRRAEEIEPGDLVATADHGARPVRWVGRAAVMAAELAHFGNLRPVRIRADAFGRNRPSADLNVSQQHRILVTGKICERMFGSSEVLVAAKHLIALDGVEIVEEAASDITYVHLMFDGHEIVTANNLHTESFFVGDQSRSQVGQAQRRELARLFPELAEKIGSGFFEPARPFVAGGRGRKLAARHAQNRGPMQ